MGFYEDCLEEKEMVHKYLDKLDLTSDLIAYDHKSFENFIDFISKKYPYTTKISNNLFDHFSFDEFEEYLYEKYDVDIYEFREQRINSRKLVSRSKI